MKQPILCQKLILKLRELRRIANNTYLCIKYPFLYPRNRFDGKHHAYILSTIVYKLQNRSLREIGIHIQHIKKTENIPNSEYDSYFPGLILKLAEHILYIKYRTETKEYYLDNYLNNKFYVRGIRIHKPFFPSGPYNICLYVSQKEEDNTKWGFCYKRIYFIENKFINNISKIIEWIDQNILDKIFILPKYTELDDMPDGWRKAFGLQICEEIKQSLLKTGGRKALNQYRIMQIKEKFGGLRWYDEYSTKEIQNIISKYEYISYRTCIICGKPAKYRSTGWICPYCEEHIENKDNAELIYLEKN